MTWSNNIKVDAIGLAAEVVDLRRELEQQAVLLGKGSEREAKLLAANAELRAKLNDPARLHAHCVRYLTDAQVAHLFGERMTEIVNSRDKLEAENAALKADKARLEKYIAEKLHQLEVENTGQEVQIEQLEAENAALKTALDHQMNYQRELRADKDRLDWLDKTGCWLTVPGSRKGQKFFAGTARAVIDSEMGIEQ